MQGLKADCLNSSPDSISYQLFDIKLLNLSGLPVPVPAGAINLSQSVACMDSILRDVLTTVPGTQ